MFINYSKLYLFQVLSSDTLQASHLEHNVLLKDPWYIVSFSHLSLRGEKNPKLTKSGHQDKWFSQLLNYHFGHSNKL